MAFSPAIITIVSLSALVAFTAAASIGSATTGSPSAGNAQCQMNGQSYVGSMFDGTDAFYYCKRDGSGGATAEAIGCISNGQRVYDLALFQKGDNIYRCRAGDTTVSNDLWGCAMKNADGTVTQKSIACTWDVGTDPRINYVQTCLAKGGTAVITQMYCLYTYRGGRIQVNEGCYRVFTDDGMAAGCKRNADGISLTLNTWPAKNSAAAAAAPQSSGMSECPIDSRK